MELRRIQKRDDTIPAVPLHHEHPPLVVMVIVIVVVLILLGNGASVAVRFKRC